MNNSQLHILPALPSTDGHSVRISRIFHSHTPTGIDPFLLFDEIRSNQSTDYMGGFPDHPHRGFQTVTYLLSGCLQHRDHMGNEGLLTSGMVQWMSAGSGIIHSEMPKNDNGLFHGFQVWINLPAKEKMSPPSYQEYNRKQIPVTSTDSACMKIIAGEVSLNGKTIRGPVKGITTNPDFFDITLNASTRTDIPLNKHKQTLLYVYKGNVHLVEQKLTIHKQHMATISSQSSIALHANEEARLLLLAGYPLNEPIASYGPFVMNTREEINQAIDDFRNGTLVQAH